MNKNEIDYHSLTDEKIEELLGGNNIGIGGNVNETVSLSVAFKQIKTLFDSLFDFKLLTLIPSYDSNGLLNGFEIHNSRDFKGESGTYKPSSLDVWSFSFDIHLNSFKAGYCNMVLEFYFQPVDCNQEVLDELKYIGDTQYMGHFAYFYNEDGYTIGLGVRGTSETRIEFLKDLMTLEYFLTKLSCVQQILNSTKI